VRMPRKKPRNWLASVTYRVGRFVPANAMLDLAAITHRLAFEKVGAWGDNPFLHRHIKPTDRVLEIGCSSGRVLSKVQAAERVGIDTDAKAIERGRKEHPELTLLCADARAYSGDFDVVILSHVLEHIDEPEALLKSLRFERLYIEVPDFEVTPLNPVRAQRGLIAHTDADHVAEFTRDELEDLFRSSGLDVIDHEFRWGFLRYWLAANSAE
jgi:SAM-dependent methyltransferase